MKNMFVEQLDNELIKYENMGILFDNRKVLSDFNLSVKKKQKALLRGKSGVEKLLF
jgi:putative ABC transport system ATP-binding protein